MRDKRSRELERTEPRRLNEVEAKRATAATQKPGEVDDARRGREYQGTGIANRKGRFGSSERPEDLEKKR